MEDDWRHITDPRVRAAMRRVPRHLFVPRGEQHCAYADSPLPIGHGQTISQPSLVAFMSAALGLRGDERVLEIGTGSGYQTAVLAELAHEVYSIEILPPLARRAREVLLGLGYDNLHLRIGDGYGGWPEAAPFEAILLTACTERVPEPLFEQLALGGRLLAPVGARDQELVLYRKTAEGVEAAPLMPVRFVPMTGRTRQQGTRTRRR